MSIQTLKRYAFSILVALLAGSQFIACGGGSNPLAPVPDESPVEGLQTTWTLQLETTEVNSSCAGLIEVGATNSRTLTVSDTQCIYNSVLDWQDEAAADSEDSQSGTYTVDGKCSAGGNAVAFYSENHTELDGCVLDMSEATDAPLTLASSGEDLTGTFVTKIDISNCPSNEVYGDDPFNEVTEKVNLSCTFSGIVAVANYPVYPVIPVDSDSDGWADNNDCDDTNSTTHPHATEVPNDGIDQDCDGSDLIIDDYEPLPVNEDGDNSAATLDCNDHDATIYPGATEIADDGIDQDCNGSDLITSPVIDTDGDSILDDVDNCIDVKNKAQVDTDGDLIGDECDVAENPLDPDNDQIEDANDNCPTIYNRLQHDPDGDGMGNDCDDDDDGDTIPDDLDNCRLDKNVEQTDTDGDGKGNACDSDKDGDTIKNKDDNCPLISNIDQSYVCDK
jgi:hypothetical protein